VSVGYTTTSKYDQGADYHWVCARCFSDFVEASEVHRSRTLSGRCVRAPELLIWGGERCILCCMSATRTQVYLTEQQRQRIDALVEAEGVTMAEIIRRALDLYLEAETPDPELALAATFGLAPDAMVPARDEWDRG